MADQVNRLGGMDAVIHNAGVHIEPQRAARPHGGTLAVTSRDAGGLRVAMRLPAADPTATV